MVACGPVVSTSEWALRQNRIDRLLAGIALKFIGVWSVSVTLLYMYVNYLFPSLSIHLGPL